MLTLDRALRPVQAAKLHALPLPSSALLLLYQEDSAPEAALSESR